LALQQVAARPQLARAESLLGAGRLQPALQLAEQAARAHLDDPATLILLGRIRLAWPVFGRFQADSLFTRAGALDSFNPEPFYYRGQVGLRLGGDDGEEIARRGLVRVLELNPEYRDAWALWSTLYRGESERHEAVDALARHVGDSNADLWRAGLLVELGMYDPADSLLESLALAHPADPAPRAWLARSLFEQRRDREAGPVYDAAVEHAAADTGDVLWRQVRSIATPRERQAYVAAGSEGREAFFRLFWARRNPDLRATVNGRIGEHFRRMAVAQQYFALLHPQSRYHHSRLRRTVLGGVGAPPGVDLAQLATDIAGTRQARVADTAVTAGLAPRLDSADQETPNLEDGLDDRGRILVRYGTPQERYVWNGDAETWRYSLPEGYLQVTFARRTEDGGGDQVVTPVVAGEAEAARYLLATDRPSLNATLRFSFWPASFRRAVGRLTDLVLFPDSAGATAVLFDAAGREAARDSATGRALHLTAAPGQYVLALDAERGGRLGRFRGTIALPPYGWDSLAVSGLLVASGEVAAARPALEAAAPAGLQLPAQRPFRVFAEVYGLAAAGGALRYDAVYRFERTGSFLGLTRHHLTTVSFRRELAPADPAVETLVIDPGRFARGHYRLTLEVHDRVSDMRAASAILEFDLR
jgi:tetratricopeptide (TPR) repeat protein